MALLLATGTCGVWAAWLPTRQLLPSPSTRPIRLLRTYLAVLNIPDLKVAEVMVFDNNAYVRVVEQSTGIGAFELLVDPATLAVTPEPGPNMMWNLKYSALNHQYMMGGMDGGME